MAFGSLGHRGGFISRSDIDIAAWGIRPEDTFGAIGAVMDMAVEIEVNLADGNTCPLSLPHDLTSTAHCGVLIPRYRKGAIR